MVPLNLMNGSKKADYVLTGQWATKAYKEAARYGGSISKFVTPNVEAAVEQKMAELRSRGENV